MAPELARSSLEETESKPNKPFFELRKQRFHSNRFGVREIADYFQDGNKVLLGLKMECFSSAEGASRICRFRTA